MAQIVILGAGLSGLSSAYFLEQKGFYDLKIFEKNSSPGGLLRSFNQDGFTFDFTGHLLHVNNNNFYNFLNSIAGIENFDNICRNSSIYSRNIHTAFPYQMNLAGLPENVIINCISGFINRKSFIKKPKSFYEWVLKYFGPGFAKNFFIPYNNKLLSFNTKKITPSWTSRFVPQTNIKDLLSGALNKKNKTSIGYNSYFYYPKNGGINYLIDNFKNKIKTKIYTNYNCIEIDIKNKILYFDNGHKEYYEYLITTIPLNNLLNNFSSYGSTLLRSPSFEGQAHFKNISKKLICNSVINFNLGFNRENITDYHWIYYPEKDFNFYRIGFWNNINKNSVPKGHSAIYGEISYIPGTKSEKELFNLTKKSIEQTLKIFNLTQKNIVTEKILHIDHAYVIYDFWREKNINKILETLKNLNIHSIGRYGEWNYSSMQEAVLQAKNIADEFLTLNKKEQRGKNEAYCSIL